MRIALALILLATPAAAQQQQFRDSAGRNAGRAVTDSAGSTTYYDAAGRTTARSTTSGNQTTVYDGAGRKTGTIQWSK